MLTPAQLLTLKNDILVTNIASLQVFVDAVDDQSIADWYNTLVAPAFTVWRSAVTLNELLFDGTFDWTRVDNLSVGKARIWDWMTQMGSINPSQANIRSGIDASWIGTAADLAVRTGIYVHCKRSATRVERLFATGTGSVAVPAMMGFEGLLSYLDIALTLRNVGG